MQIVTKLPNENIQNYQLEMFDSGGSGEVNYQTQIVTKLPNENIQNYQLEIFESRGGKLPNANCDQTTKWKYPKLLTSNVFGGGVNYQMQIVTKLPNENIQNYQLEMFNSGGGELGCKLPNADCDQTTKWKYPKLPTRNVWIWRGKLPNANCHQTTKWKYPKTTN